MKPAKIFKNLKFRTSDNLGKQFRTREGREFQKKAQNSVDASVYVKVHTRVYMYASIGNLRIINFTGSNANLPVALRHKSSAYQ